MESRVELSLCDPLEATSEEEEEKLLAEPVDVLTEACCELFVESSPLAVLFK